MKEKRKASRLEQVMPVRQKSQEADSIEQTHAKDISGGGLRIATDAKLHIGSKLKIEVLIPGTSDPYYAQGEVVWFKDAQGDGNKKFDMGVKFLRIIPKDQVTDF